MKNKTVKPALAGQIDRGVGPLAECTVEDLVNMHALVYGRCKIWTSDLTDTSAMAFRWSRQAWWKAMWYSHRGDPKQSSSWGVYAGCDGYTGPGDAELTHFARMPPAPDAIEPGREFLKILGHQPHMIALSGRRSRPMEQPVI